MKKLNTFIVIYRGVGEEVSGGDSSRNKWNQEKITEIS